MVMALLVSFLRGPANAEMVWDTADGNSPGRRLGLTVVLSHTGSSDANCIVTGYDSAYPTRVAVGGPCSKIKNKTPLAGFSYVDMGLVWAELSDSTTDKKFEMKDIQNKHAEFSKDSTDGFVHGTYSEMAFKEDTLKDAGMFFSLSGVVTKKEYKVTQNEFLTSQSNDTINACIIPCAGKPPQSCTCPKTALTVPKGQYKYSIFVAAYNIADKGWENLIQKYKNKQTNELEASFNVLQVMDFTKMNSDKITITGPGGTSMKYADMEVCDVHTGKTEKNSTKKCSAYKVTSINVESAAWSGKYTFPTFYNMGSWQKGKATQEGTKAAQVMCLRPTSKIIKEINPSSTTAILLSLDFNVDGMTATKTSGTYFLYDPTVTTVKTAAGGTGTSNTQDKTTASSAVTTRLVTVSFAFLLTANAY